ncbi:unnamed protein product [Phytomonas sp. EM1]|nr:unnamed protein product [Phytomonas sp. EM1]|eukprot:CCW65292.1 unnamed protein product [Phytomonas sp. isolate EM1]
MHHDKHPTTIPGTCPTPLELGRAGWDILHTAAATYPYQPTPAQQKAMRDFIYSWSEVYACEWCGYHMRRYLQSHPPLVDDKPAITRYLCELHNDVNRRLGKEIYDCDPANVLRRWHPKFPDMQDQPRMEERVAEAFAKKAKETAEMEAAHRTIERSLLRPDPAQTTSAGSLNTKEESLVVPPRGGGFLSGFNSYLFGKSNAGSAGEGRGVRREPTAMNPPPEVKANASLTGKEVASPPPCGDHRADAAAVE